MSCVVLPGSVTFHHLGTVVCLLAEELIEHPVLAQLLDPRLRPGALVRASSSGRELLAGAEDGGQGQDQDGGPHGPSESRLLLVTCVSSHWGWDEIVNRFAGNH